MIIGRMIQGAAGSTILACGMSLLSVDSSGAGQMGAITLRGAASAAGAGAGPLAGGLLVDATGWQGLFWIDAAIAAALIPLAKLAESRDPNRSRSIDVAASAASIRLGAPAAMPRQLGSRHVLVRTRMAVQLGQCTVRLPPVQLGSRQRHAEGHTQYHTVPGYRMQLGDRVPAQQVTAATHHPPHADSHDPFDRLALLGGQDHTQRRAVRTVVVCRAAVLPGSRPDVMITIRVRNT
jgi:hypothetical protein